MRKAMHNLVRKFGTRMFTTFGVAIATYVEATPDVEQSVVSASVLLGGYLTDIALSKVWKEKH